jgi:transposase InsO family protein
VKHAFVARERTHFPLEVLCRLLGVARSGFHDYERRLANPGPDADEALRQDLRTCHTASRGTYGRPRLVKDLRDLGHPVGPKRVVRLMREEGLRGKAKGRWKPRTTDSGHTRPVAENVLQRRFEVTSPVPAWVSDITYIETREGWLYLAAVLSVQTRQVLGYSLAERMPDDLVVHAFLNAWHRKPAGSGILFHSDRGSQYASGDFRRTITGLGFVPSMSRKGNCWDNAVAESFFATLKNEEVTRPYPTKAAAHAGIANYIHGFYNPQRRHSALGYLSPDNYARKLNAA